MRWAPECRPRSPWGERSSRPTVLAAIGQNCLYMPTFDVGPNVIEPVGEVDRGKVKAQEDYLCSGWKVPGTISGAVSGC